MSGSLQGVKLNGRYLLAERIGEGGMAEVHRAEDTLLERVVAVKVLRPQYSADPDFLARFQQEARFAAKLAHPNIVSVYDVGSDGSTHFIVMEYVEGRSLKEAIQAGAPFTPTQAVEIASQILSALSFAHQRGVVHRDVKPQNVLIGPEGQAKVADFGIARAGTGSQTTRGIVLATVQYASPEQLSGQPATEASDLYSLGVVLYEMLTGRLPFEAESSVAVALKHVQSPPPALRKLNPAIPASLEAVVLQSLAKAPADRFSSAAEMRRALRLLQDGEQSTAVFRPPAVAAGETRVMRPAASRDSAAPRRGVDWAAIVLGLLAFVLVAAAVPLGLRLYNNLYAGEPEPSPTRTPAAIVDVRPTATTPPSPTSSPRPSPTASPMPSPTASPVPEIAVPRVVEMRFDQAQKELEAVGLKIRLAGEEFSPVYPAGIVVNQSPTPDKKIVSGGTIDVVVSKGPELALIQRVVGIPFAEAKTLLENAGFRVKQSDRFHEQVPAGIVLEQQPGALEQAPKGSEVTLVVSKGPAPTPSPTVTPKPSPTATPRPSPTPKPSPSPTKIPDPVVSETGVPTAGTTLQQQLEADQVAMLAGGKITYGDFACAAETGRICVLMYRVTKGADLKVNGLTTGGFSLAVWTDVGVDAILAQRAPSFWVSPSCGTGCSRAIVGIFADDALVETRPLAKP